LQQDHFFVSTSKDKTSPSTILCLIDLSESSRKAVEWSIALSKKLNAHLTVIFNYRLDGERKEDAVQAKRNRDVKAAHDFAEIEQELFRNAGIHYDLRSEIGFAYDRIEEHARKKNILFAVVQKKMAFDQKDFVEELVDKIQVPLVIIPGK
jgi:hypothetical protein